MKAAGFPALELTGFFHRAIDEDALHDILMEQLSSDPHVLTRLCLKAAFQDALERGKTGLYHSVMGRIPDMSFGDVRTVRKLAECRLRGALESKFERDIICAAEAGLDGDC